MSITYNGEILNRYADIIKKGDIFWGNLGIKEKAIGCEQYGSRPILIIQNDMGNMYSDIVIAATITAAEHCKTKLPINYYIERSPENGLEKDSIILLNQIRSIDKARLTNKMGQVTPRQLNEINKRLLISFGINMIDLI